MLYGYRLTKDVGINLFRLVFSHFYCHLSQQHKRDAVNLLMMCRVWMGTIRHQ